MTFDEIGEALNLSHQRVIKIYQKAMRKIASDRYSMALLEEWKDYHHALKARSLECRASHLIFTPRFQHQAPLEDWVGHRSAYEAF